MSDAMWSPLHARDERERGAPLRAPVNRTVTEQRAHLAREIVETLVLVGIIFFIVHAAIDSRSIVDSAMAPGFQPGQFVLVNKIAYLFAGPSRGEVVLFADPRNPKADPRMGRIVGVPGDTVSVTPTSVAINGVTLNEPYTQIPPGTTENSVIASVKLSTDQYYVILDSRQRTDANDSRGFGVLPRSNILGKAVAVFWPLKDFHWVNTYSNTFSGVK
jgi:signal peptidase I